MPRLKKDEPRCCDSPEKMALCLSCERSYCPGSCALISTPAGARRRGGRPGNLEMRERFLELYEQGWTDQEIAKAVDAAPSTVQRYRHMLELKPNMRRKRDGKA